MATTEIKAFDFPTATGTVLHNEAMARLALLYKEGWEIFTPPYTITVERGVEPGLEHVTRVQFLLIKED